MGQCESCPGPRPLGWGRAECDRLPLPHPPRGGGADQTPPPDDWTRRRPGSLRYYSDIILYCLPLLCSGWKWPFHAPHSYSFLEKALLSPVIARTQLSVLAVVASVSSRELLAHRQSLVEVLRKLHQWSTYRAPGRRSATVLDSKTRCLTAPAASPLQ